MQLNKWLQCKSENISSHNYNQTFTNESNFGIK